MYQYLSTLGYLNSLITPCYLLIANVRASLGTVHSELQIRGGIEDNSKVIFLILNENICCDLSSRRDGPNDGSQNMFLCRNMAKHP